MIGRLNDISNHSLMKLHFKIVLFVCLVCLPLFVVSQINTIPIIKLFDREYYKYEVQAGETLYGLSRRFNTTSEEIIAMNPFLVEGLKVGQVLIIPIKHQADKEVNTQQELAVKPEKEKRKKTVQEDSVLISAASILFEEWEYEYYTVEKWRENLVDIAAAFNVDIEDLRQHNPNVPARLSRGSLLMIPIQKQATLSEFDEQTQQAMTQDDKQSIIPRLMHKPSLAVLLPFMLDDTTFNSTERYVEFYEGILLAADSLKKLRFSFDLSVFDIGRSKETMQNVLSSSQLSEVDFVIAAANLEQMNLLSNWSLQENKHLILPFSSRIPETENNPYIFQINPPQAMNHRRLLEIDANFYSDKNILFIHTPNQESDERADLFNAFKNRLNEESIAFKVLVDREFPANVAYSFPDTVAAQLSMDQENLIIPAPLSLTESNRIITLIGSAANAKPKARITLLGYPEWLALSKNNLPQLYRLNTHIYTNYYADFQQEKNKNFQKSFAYEFGKDLLNTYPRYALMGYDIMMYFIPKISGSDMEIEALQHDFNFVQNDPAGGKYNQNLYLIRYSTNRKIESILLSH